MPRHGLSESVTCQWICPQNRLVEHSADFAGNCECYKENGNPKPVSLKETRKLHIVTQVHQNYRTGRWVWGMIAGLIQLDQWKEDRSSNPWARAIHESLLKEYSFHVA